MKKQKEEHWRPRFSLLERVLARPAGWVRKLSSDTVENAFWFLALVGLLPALRADLLFPHDWIENAEANFSVSSIENPFGFLSLVPAFAVAVIAAARRKPAGWLAVLPFLTVLLANTKIEEYLAGLSSAYAVSAFVVFLYFVGAGRVRSGYFFAFAALLVFLREVDSAIGWHQIVEFVLVAIVASLVYEAGRQNWPLLKDLGRANSMAMLGRTVVLWSPTILLIAAGWWISERLTSGTEEGLYASGAVVQHCHFQALGDDGYIDCLPDGVMQVPDAWVARYTTEMGGQQCAIRFIEAEEQPFFPAISLLKCPPEDSDAVWDLAHAPFFVSVDLTVKKRFEALAAERRVATDSLVRAVESGSEQAGPRARELFQIVPKTTGLTSRDCGFLDVKCGAGNLVKSEINAAYDRGRKRAEERFVIAMQERADAVRDGVEDAAEGDTGTHRCRVR